jgi:hypothetical protein
MKERIKVVHLGVQLLTILLLRLLSGLSRGVELCVLFGHGLFCSDHVES